jgi:hypothetical protein
MATTELVPPGCASRQASVRLVSRWFDFVVPCRRAHTEADSLDALHDLRPTVMRKQFVDRFVKGRAPALGPTEPMARTLDEHEVRMRHP